MKWPSRISYLNTSQHQVQYLSTPSTLKKGWTITLNQTSVLTWFVKNSGMFGMLCLQNTWLIETIHFISQSLSMQKRVYALALQCITYVSNRKNSPFVRQISEDLHTTTKQYMRCFLAAGVFFFFSLYVRFFLTEYMFFSGWIRFRFFNVTLYLYKLILISSCFCT